MADEQARNTNTFDFYNHKIKFFSSYSNNTEREFEKINKALGQATFESVYQQQSKLEQEYKDLFAVLKKNKDDHIAFWLYCYFCAGLLEKYYRGYSNTKKAEEYEDIKNKIRDCYIDQVTDSIETQQSDQSFKNKVVTVLKDWLSTPVHASKTRDRAGFINLLRVYLIFSRFFSASGLSLSKAANLMDKLDDVLRSLTDADHILLGFNRPGQTPDLILNCLSVGLFAIRSLVNIGIIIKHTFFASEEEKRLGRINILINETKKRGVDIFNHSGWAAVNFITNFREICHISGPVGNWIVFAFLTVDIATLLYKRQEAKEAYLLKLRDYKKEKKNLLASFDSNDVLQKERLLMLDEQISALQIDWETTGSKLDLMVGATFMLMAGFAASMLVTPPIAVMACYLVCVVAVAIYLSDEVYAKYKKSSLELDYVDHDDKQKLKIAEEAYNAARKEYALTLVKYTVMPTLLIATYAVCWPAAVSLTILMFGYEMFKAYDKHRKEKKEKENNCLSHENGDQQDLDEARPAADVGRVLLLA